MPINSTYNVCIRVCIACMLLSGTASAATFTVSNTDDSGPGSLRQAILNANATTGNDTIELALSAGTIIAPLSALPEIDPVTPTDTTTLTASVRVGLSGSNVVGAVSGLVLRGDNCTVRGIALVNWGGYGIEIYGDSYRIANCFVGNDGTSSFPNALGGVLVESVEDGTIGRFDGSGTANVISGNGGPGIRVESAAGSGLVIAGNAIGTNATGTAALPNAEEGILLQGGNVQIGGSAPAERNLISGNSGSGVQINGGANIVLRNNIIGMNQAGTAALPNTLSGVSVANPVTGVIIGGQIAGRGNYISGNTQYGILTGGTGVFIYGNVIGLDLVSTNPIPNGLSGVQVADGECTIGGTTAGAANTISGHTAHAVSESGGDGALVVIRGNAIYGNGTPALFMNSGAATATPTPIATCLSPLAGTSVVDATVDVYVDDDDEGALYLDTVTADGAGNWTSAIDLSAHIGRNLTLTATKPAGSTSPFSAPVEISATFAPCDTEGEGEGTTEGEGEGTPEGEGEIDCGYEDDDSGSFGSCTLGTRFGQRPAPNGNASSGFYGSDNGLNRYQSDNFIDVEGSIAGIRWWGAGVLFGSPCTRTPNRFRIEIYSGTDLGARTFVSAQEVTATLTATDGQAFLSPVYQFEAALATPLVVQNGWLSIVGIDDEDCYFYWYRSDAGDSIRGDQIGTDTPSLNGGDFAFCLLPCAPEGGVEGETEGEGEGQVEGTVEGEEPLDCPIGYAPNAGGTACEPCAPGSYSPDGIECLDCPSGQFSANFGSIVCFPCSLGSAPNAGQTACETCEPGTYSPDSLACLDCPEGTFSSGSGASLCADCPNGTEPNTGGTACNDCPPGAYSPDGIECLDCPEGSVSAADGAASCVTCPPGTEPNEARTACVPIIAEGEVDGEGEGEGGFDCPAGFSSEGDSCVPCAAGTYSPDGVECLDCPTGLVSGTGATECTACAPGTAPNVTQTACEPCASGSFSADGVACLDCPAGSVSGFNGATACETCPEGTAPNAMQSICIELATEGEGEGNAAFASCPADSLFSMTPLPVDAPDAGYYRSDEPSGDLRFERFEGVDAPILAVRWWGTNLSGGPCSRAVGDWEIRFYEGSSFSLGNLASSQRVTATRRSTGAVVNNLGVDEFEADLPIPVSLESGWISIVGVDDAACNFFWYRSGDGDDGHLRVVNEEPASGAGSDLAFCLSPSVLVAGTPPVHSTDQNADNVINLSELLRLVQFYNSSRIGCADGTEDGYAPGATDETCRFHAADYNPRDWRFTLSELLRVIQFYNLGGYSACPDEASEDGYCVGEP